MPDPNVLVRTARERTPSRIAPGEWMSRAELAEAINTFLWKSTGRRYELSGHHVAKWERGAVRCPVAHGHAARLATEALDIAHRYGSERITGRVRTFRSTLPGSTAETVELDDALARLYTAS